MGGGAGAKARIFLLRNCSGGQIVVNRNRTHCSNTVIIASIINNLQFLPLNTFDIFDFSKKLEEINARALALFEYLNCVKSAPVTLKLRKCRSRATSSKMVLLLRISFCLSRSQNKTIQSVRLTPALL